MEAEVTMQKKVVYQWDGACVPFVTQRRKMHHGKVCVCAYGAYARNTREKERRGCVMPSL